MAYGPTKEFVIPAKADVTRRDSGASERRDTPSPRLRGEVIGCAVTARSCIFRRLSMGLHPADVKQLDDDHDQKNRENGKRNRSTLAEKPGADAELVGVGREE